MLMQIDLTLEQENLMQERLREQECVSIAGMLKFMKEHFGEKAYEIFVNAQGEGRRSHFSKLAEENGDNSIEALVKIIFESNNEQASEYTMVETESGFQMNVTKCWPYKIAKRHGIMEQLFLTCCSCEQFFVEGFNPDIGFTRTKTLMLGDDCCDHFFYYKDKDAGEQH